jgi:hypothetical protein
MKFLRLIILLIQRGSLSQQPIDFEIRRKQMIDPAYFPTSTPSPKKNNPIKSYLLSTPVGYSLFANLAYLKNTASMNNMYFISDNYKLIYIRILKSASTSLLKEFLPLVDGKLRNVYFSDEQIDVLGFYYQQKRFEPAHLAYTKFALVRNPFRRIVSVYLDLFDPRAVPFTYSSYWFGVLKKGMTFKDFIKTIDQIPLSLLGPHFTPQWYILKKASDLKDIRIYRIEKDVESLTQFLNQYSIALPHVNVQRSAYDYRSYYDPETLAIVNKLYQHDVSLFGYQEDYNALRQYIAEYYENRTL